MKYHKAGVLQGHDDHYQITINHSKDCSMTQRLGLVMKSSSLELEIQSARSRINNNGFSKKRCESDMGTNSLVSAYKEATFAHQQNKSNGKFMNRRKSIDCTYTLKSQSAKLYKLRESEQEDQDTLLPQVVNPQNNCSAKVGGISAPSGRVRRRALSGQDLTQSKQSLTQPTKSFKLLAPTRTNFLPVKNRRSSSVDYTSSHFLSQVTSSQKIEKKSLFGSNSFSQRKSTFEKNASSHTNSLKNESTNKSISLNRISFNNVQTTWHKNNQNHTSRKSSFDPSSLSSDDNSRPTTERMSTPRPPSYKGFPLDKRTQSLSSISSVGSNERLSARLNLSLGRRRASLPNAILNYQPPVDINNSPEFYKAINELSSDLPLQQETMRNTDFIHPIDRSASSLAPGKEPIRRDLLQSIQEVTHENSFNLSFKLNSSSTNNKDCLKNGIMQSTQRTISNGKETVNSIAKVEIKTNGVCENEKDKSNIGNHEKLLKSFFKKGDNTTSQADVVQSDNHLQTPEFNSPYSCQSFPHELNDEVPKINNDETKQSNKNSLPKRHQLEGVGPNRRQHQFEEYFQQFDYFIDTDDIIDDSNVEEDDDNLCDEDYSRKRIIMWLMNVQTGGDAEQVVRDDTPPPTPEPGTQETAIVVIYQGNEIDG